MRLFAAIVPPRGVLDELTAVVRSIQPDHVEEPPARKGFRSRFGGGSHGAHSAARPAVTPEATPASHDELAVTPMHLMYLPITGFGNVTLGDSVQLAKALRTQAATWARPRLHFAGSTALEWRGDESVWAKLDGELDTLNVIGRGVPQVVQRLGFFVDRRQFRPWLSVGTITEHTTAPYLERLVAALEAFRGQEWTIEAISLMKRVPDGEPGAPFEEHERMPLADA